MAVEQILTRGTNDTPGKKGKHPEKSSHGSHPAKGKPRVTEGATKRNQRSKQRHQKKSAPNRSPKKKRR
ncbi:MAG: hypothetical protein ACTHM6_02095 [Tepidisphaeraceae bacterium]